MKYELTYSKRFSKAFNKLDGRTQKLTNEILDRLANDETLEPKYKDHKLKGEYKDFRECHILPDLLLIYQKQENLLILTAFRLGSHSELF